MSHCSIDNEDLLVKQSATLEFYMYFSETFFSKDVILLILFTCMRPSCTFTTNFNLMTWGYKLNSEL